MIDKNYQEAVKDIKQALTVLEKQNDAPQTASQHPDAAWHLRVSVAKSIVRILAGGVLCAGDLFWAGSLLILAEGLGIVEELV